MLRNPELRRALLVGGLLTLLASAAAMSLSGWQAACVALALSLGLVPQDLKLVTAVLFLAILVLGGARKKKVKFNA